MKKRDIQGRADFTLLMSSFYGEAIEDPIIGSKFDNIDMEKHLPRIVEFWMSIIFCDGDYKGSPFDKHIPLNLESPHFDQWLLLFEQHLIKHFEGENAKEVLKRAQSIGKIFLYKIDGLAKLS